MGVLVRAKTPNGKVFGSDERKAVGYYDLKRRYDGDEFELSQEQHFSETWMERIGPIIEHDPVVLAAKAVKQDLGRAHMQTMKAVIGGD
jgi:hypothetical protein